MFASLESWFNNKVSNVADAVYNSDEDEELASIQSDAVRKETKTNRLIKQVGSVAKIVFPLISNILAFTLFSRCKYSASSSSSSDPFTKICGKSTQPCSENNKIIN